MNGSERVSIGVRAVDRALNGGVRPGGIVLLAAPPSSQVEEFLYSFSEPRETLYATTVRGEDVVREAFEATGVVSGGVDANDVVVESHVESARDQVNDAVKRLDERSTLVVDSVDVIEDGDGDREYRYFLSEVQTELRNTGSVAVFYGVKKPPVPGNRRVTEQVVDVSLDLSCMTQGEDSSVELSVLKNRGGEVPEDPLTIDLTSGVSVDRSQNIG